MFDNTLIKEDVIPLFNNPPPNIRTFGLSFSTTSSLQTFSPLKEKKYAVILGNEVKGVHQEVVDASDGCLEIPQFGTKHSMNVSVTAGIVIWHFAQAKF